MPLKNSQFNQIMRDYDRRRFAHLREHEERMHLLYKCSPELGETIDAINSISAGLTRAVLTGSDDAAALRSQLTKLRKKRDQLLSGIGCSGADLEVQYTCPDCKDTGYINGVKCHCLRQAGIDLLYSQSHLQQILQEENFDHFSLDYYSKEPNPLLKGVSNYDHMINISSICRKYAAEFHEGCGNLLFTGTTGVGKTFLTNCIAREVLNQSYSVMSISAVELFDHFQYGYRNDEEEDETQYIMECDLLVIDDLGTEVATLPSLSQFFHLINDRLMNRKCTIISTNIKFNELRTVYSERIASRLLSSYRILPLYGDDIRALKKFRSRERRS